MKKQFFTKGRQSDTSLVSQIISLLGNDLTQRDLLIENLHCVQDHFNGLSKDLIAALAEAMRLSQAQVYEVASFYAHFYIDRPVPKQKACNSITCSLFGKVDGYGVPCVGQCAQAPVFIDETKPDPVPDYIPYENYTYKPLPDPEHVLDQLEKANLRGLGGAGFPVARKWRFLLDAPDNRVLVVNADEGEPGTFKDRYCLETNPHKMLEGMLIAAHVINAKDIYIYLRDEYAQARHILETEIPKIKTDRTIHLRRGAGAYICGEETALLESLEGKRGLPRIKPPFPAQNGLFGRPTLINNVETLWRVQDILENGIEAGSKRFYSVSGRVKNPGVYEAPVDISARQLVADYAGGMLDGHQFKAYLPGGASGGILPEKLADLPLNFGSLEEYGCFVGSAALVILSDQDNMKQVVTNLMAFFDHESCGQCTPCRVGCEKISMMLDQNNIDKDLMMELSAVMQSSSICGLGQAAPNPLRGALTYFAEDFA
ncbi:MAG: NAD(P)H-dependent oxidoreductase subunit E [Methylocystaceae bacterium]|nr:NAD(P)H-dependent oxidoreductase subunit E [Methylocystaceae bacterium]